MTETMIGRPARVSILPSGQSLELENEPRELGSGYTAVRAPVALIALC